MAKIKKNKYKGKNSSLLNPDYPKSFFRSIDIKPFIKSDEKPKAEDLEKIILKKFGNKTKEMFHEALIDKSIHSGFNLSHTRLDFAKIWYGTEFNRICRIANILQKFKIPNIRNILDLGGGPGHIAFFMLKLWPESSITVFDKFSNIGKEWAEEINENRVNFENGRLPDLSSLQGSKYDLIVMSRVLGNLDSLFLPNHTNTFDTASYFESSEGQDLSKLIEEIGQSINNHLSNDGHLLIIDSWSDFRVLLISTALEKNGLFIDLDHFEPTDLSVRYSPMVFSKTRSEKVSQNLPLALANIVNKDRKIPFKYYFGQMAESFRSIFNSSNRVFKSTFFIKSIGISFKQEILENSGIAIVYITSSDGKRVATIASSMFIPFFVKKFNDERIILEAYKSLDY